MSTSNVSETYVKHGQICTNGLGCATGGDRSLGDFLQVTTDRQGAALVSYVFDTSGNSSAGEDAGPEVISRQTAGPSRSRQAFALRNFVKAAEPTIRHITAAGRRRMRTVMTTMVA